MIILPSLLDSIVLNESCLLILLEDGSIVRGRLFYLAAFNNFFHSHLPRFLGFPGGASGKRHVFDPWVLEDHLEEGNAAHSTIPAWTEEPGRLDSYGVAESWTQLKLCWWFSTFL